MIDTYANITRHKGNKPAIKDLQFKVMEDCENDYHKEMLPTIPAGTIIVGDFAGDFGAYALAEVDGVLHRVKINVHELHKVNWGPFETREL